MNNAMVDYINTIFDNKISEINRSFEKKISENIHNPIFTAFLHDVNMLQLKNIEIINIERNKCFYMWNEYLKNQEFENFISIGQEMYKIKHSDRKSYDHIVDKAFSSENPLSLYKFKYASI